MKTFRFKIKKGWTSGRGGDPKIRNYQIIDTKYNSVYAESVSEYLTIKLCNELNLLIKD